MPTLRLATFSPIPMTQVIVLENVHFILGNGSLHLKFAGRDGIASGKEDGIMNSTVYELLFAIVLASAAIALVALFFWYKRSNSQRRMMSMMRRAGLDPEIARQGDTKAIIEAVRRRCRKCQTEDICERWLAGEVKGDNDFCPNAGIFEILASQAERVA